MIGSLIGGYRVVTELGQGPSGKVFYAEHPTIGRRAAIKVLSPKLSAGTDRLDRFLTDLKVVSGIRHPNIVDVLDIGKMPGGETFVVMEMLEGETLGERLERSKTLDEITTVRVLVQIASAVGAAHERGLVHGSLKGENVFITNSVDYPDFVKLLDFGALKLLPPGPYVPSPYLAPELRTGGTPNVESDVYAVGILAYEMLVGAVPFAREEIEARPMPPMPAHQRRPGLSQNLSDIIQRALDPVPEDRWSSLREFRRAIELALAAPTPQAFPAPAKVTEDPSPEETKRTERVQAKKVGKALSSIIVRRLQENRLQLPTMPLVALKCLDVLRDPDATFPVIAKVIEQDPVIAARLLRVVNSAAYSRRQTVSKLEQAVAQIGVKPLRILLIEFAACQIFTSRSAGIRQKFKLIWEHCLAVGMLSRDLAIELKSRVDPDVAYLGGLLHDVGKPIVAGLLLEAERKLVDELDVPWMSETLWQKTVAESHRGVGATIAADWKLPALVAEAIEHCDAYSRAAGPHSCANLVRFANTLAKREGIYVGDVSGDEIVAAVLQGRQVLGIEESLEAKLIATLRDRTGQVVGARTHRSQAADADAAGAPIGDRSRRSRHA